MGSLGRVRHDRESSERIQASSRDLTGNSARAAPLAAAELHYSPLAPEGTDLDQDIRASIESAKAAADPGAWQRGWEAGRAMSLDDAAAQAQLVET